MKRACYTQEPAPCRLQRHSGYIHVALALNTIQTTHGGESPATWEADTHQFWEKEEVLNLEDVRTNPENYLHYVPLAIRQEGKDKAQQLLDALRDSCPVVPVPSYREGAAVCNRPADQVKLVAGLAMGGLPYYELASGDIVSLSTEDIQAIATDISAAETAWQQAKQQCWAAIDAAQGEESIATALAVFATTLSHYTAAPCSTTTSAGSNSTTSWLDSLLSGWNLRESWAKIIAGSLAGVLAGASLLTGCTPFQQHTTSPAPPAAICTPALRQPGHAHGA